jgi:MFS family permease
MKSSTSRKVYYGWTLTGVSMVLMGLVIAPSYSLQAQFVAPVAESLNCSPMAFTAHLTILVLTSMISSLFMGGALVRGNMKLIMGIAALLGAGAFAAYSFASRVWHFYVISIVLGFVYASLFLPISILLNNWFGKKLRGKAMGIAMAGSGIGAMVLNPVIGYINSTGNWRMSYRLLALLIAAVVFPVVIFTISKSPQEKGVARLGDEDDIDTNKTPAAITGLTTRQALSTGMFWFAVSTYVLYHLISALFTIIAVVYFIDIGFSPIRAANIMAVQAGVQIFGKLILGVVCDRFGTKTGATAAILIFIAGLCLLIGGAKIPVLCVLGAGMLGIGTAVCTVIVPLMTADLFGNRDYGSLMGIMGVATNLGTSIGPLFGSLVFQIGGSYVGAWITCVGLSLTALITSHLAYALRKRSYR